MQSLSSPVAQAIVAGGTLTIALGLFLLRFGSPRRWLVVALGVCVLDQAAKVFMARLAWRHNFREISLLGGWVRLDYLTNPVLGFGSSPQFLLALTAALAGALLIQYHLLLRREYRMPALTEVACALLLGGLLGILLDRVRLGHVVDYITFGSPFDYPCNIADLSALGAFPLFGIRWLQLIAAGLDPETAARRARAQQPPAYGVPRASRWAWRLGICGCAALALALLWRIPQDETALMPPLHRAADLGDADGVRALLSDGADVGLPGPRGLTPLHHAVGGGHVDVARVLLANGADVNAGAAGSGLTPLDHAILTKHPEAAALLLERGAKLSGLSLSAAIISGNPEIVRLMLESGADPGASGNGDMPPLVYAAYHRHSAKMLPLLLAAGADVNGRDAQGATALHRAAALCDTESIRILVAAGADVDARDDSGRRPLHVIGGLATALGGPEGKETAGLLVAAGADVSARSEDGKTALIRAVLRGEADWVQLLLDAGADVGAPGPEGWTALHYAAAKGLPDIAGVLLAAGADVGAEADDAATPLALARDARMAALLRRSG